VRQCWILKLNKWTSTWLFEQYYVEQPEGFEDGTGRFCKLNRILYGLRQSSRAWYLTLKDFLHSYRLSTAAADNSVFFSEDIQVAVYVDDLLIFGSRQKSKSSAS
jgi:hypothetical protein